VIEHHRCVPASAQQMFLGRDLAKILVASHAYEGKVTMAFDEPPHEEMTTALYNFAGGDLLMVKSVVHRNNAVPLHENLSRKWFVG
jgi:hypothetical protein